MYLFSQLDFAIIHMPPPMDDEAAFYAGEVRIEVGVEATKIFNLYVYSSSLAAVGPLGNCEERIK